MERSTEIKVKPDTLRHRIRTFLIGCAMGVANIIPGVSGGTIAVVFGIYEELMESLGNFLSNREKRIIYIKFLTILFAGVIVSVIGFARLLSWSYEHYPLPTVYLFIGLIIGSIPIVIRTHHDMKFQLKRLIGFILGFAVVIILSLFQKGSAAQTGTFAFDQISIQDYLYYVFCGTIAASAMIIPGISGSFILLLLGIYWIVLSSLSGLTSLLFTEGLTEQVIVRLAILGALGIGILIGIFGFSKFMNWALKNYPAKTMYTILGLMVGSLYQIYPGFEFNLHGMLAVVTLSFGIIISLKFAADPDG